MELYVGLEIISKNNSTRRFKVLDIVGDNCKLEVNRHDKAKWRGQIVVYPIKLILENTRLITKLDRALE